MRKARKVAGYGRNMGRSNKTWKIEFLAHFCDLDLGCPSNHGLETDVFVLTNMHFTKIAGLSSDVSILYLGGHWFEFYQDITILTEVICFPQSLKADVRIVSYIRPQLLPFTTFL